MKKNFFNLLLCASVMLFITSCQKSIDKPYLVDEQISKRGNPPGTNNSSANEASLPESNFSRGFGINNSGAMTGSVRNADGKVVAFLLKNNSSWFSEEGVLTVGRPEISFAINEPGDVVGSKAIGTSGVVPMLWKNGQSYELQILPGQQYGEVFDINNAGQMVGSSFNGTLVPLNVSSERATIFSKDGPPVDLGTLGGSKAAAVNINDDGHIVGFSELANGQSHAFLYKEGIMHDLGTLGGTISNANAINNNGEIVGRSLLANGAIRAFYYKDGVMQDLGTLGGAASVAFDINDKGEIVGFSRISNGQARAFLYKNGVMQDLGALGGTDSRALGINNKGEIIGHYTRSDGTVHAFIYRDGQMHPL